MIREYFQYQAKEDVEERRLAMQIEDTLKQPVAQQFRIQDLQKISQRPMVEGHSKNQKINYSR